MGIVNGKNVAVYIYDSGSWKLYACGRSCSINVSTSFVDTSTSGSGLWATFKPQKHTWNGTIEGAISLNESGQLALPALRALQISMTELYIRYERVDDSGNGYTDEGYAIIVNSSDTGSVDSIATFTIELQGTGVLTQHT